SAWCWPSTADAVRSLTLRPAIRTTAPAISISTFRCGWRAPTRVFLVPCSLSVSLLFCGDGPGGPDFDLFRTLRRDPHRLRTSLLDREPQRDLRTSFLLRRFCFARTVSAGKAEFLHRANWDSYWLVRGHGIGSRHLPGGRRALSMAYLILAAAYFLIGSIGASWLAPVRNAVPLGLFVGCILILPALGISLVKPCVVGTTARASKENVRSIGYSIYYTMVNIGGALGPLVAGWAHRNLGVENVYRIAALSVFAMFFVVIIFFREPRKAGDAPPPSIATVARNFCVVVGNWRLVLPVLTVD